MQEKRRQGTFYDSKGRLSVVRMGSFISLITAVVFAAFTVLTSNPHQASSGLEITLLLLSMSFVPKTINSFQEKS